MAANDYYTSYNSQPTNHASAYHDYDYPDRNAAPLPPLPSQSPFDDGAYTSRPYMHQTPAQSYPGASGRLHDDPDPFDDGNAIPLNGRKPKHDSTHTVSPILPHEQDDPFVRDAVSRRKRRRRDDTKEGWFKGKITWVVFVLTFVQLVVFIAEIIKNGKS